MARLSVAAVAGAEGTAPTLRFVLASASVARLKLLRSAGLDPRVVVSGVPENDVVGDPEEAVLTLAERKADAVARSTPGALVLGCDSMLDLAGRTFGKPKDAAEATERWRQLRGQRGRLVTGHCLIRTDTSARATAATATIVQFGEPSDEEISAYVASGEPLTVAGAFTIEGKGGWFIERLDGDHGTVLGVSLPAVRALMAEVGCPLTAVWPQ